MVFVDNLENNLTLETLAYLLTVIKINLITYFALSMT